MGEIKFRRSFMRKALALSAVPLIPVATRKAQAANWPSKPITLVVGFAPGGLSDTMARAYAQYLSAKLGQSIVVENKSGAGSILACDYVARAPADGYVFLYTIQTALIQNQVLYKKLPYNPSRDFTFISLMSAGSLPLCINSSIPVKDLKEFLQWAKTNPVSFGSYAPGSLPQMICTMLNKQHGLKMQTINYRGEAPMWNDVASGVTQIALGSYQGAAPRLQSAHIKPIAVMSAKRMSKLKDIPTFAEQGLTDPVFAMTPWHCILGPAGLPTDIRERMSSLMVEAGRSEQVQKFLNSFAIDDGATDWRNFERVFRDEAPLVLAAVKEIGVTLD